MEVPKWGTADELGSPELDWLRGVGMAKRLQVTLIIKTQTKDFKLPLQSTKFINKTENSTKLKNTTRTTRTMEDSLELNLV